MKTRYKLPFFDIKAAMKWARRLQIPQNLFLAMRISSAVVLSSWMPVFSHGVPERIASCLLLAAEMCYSPRTLGRFVTP